MKAKRARQAHAARKGSGTGLAKWLLIPLAVAAGACSDGLAGPAPDLEELLDPGGRSMATAKLTGGVELTWPGGKGANAPDDDRYAEATITAFEGVGPGNPGMGTFTYRVVAQDGTIHREIGVELVYVGLDEETEGVLGTRFIGVVVSDTKPCGGSGHGGPGGGGEHDEGGCSHEDEGGCSHEDGESHDDGGCSHEDGDSHEEGGCSHEDGDSHDEGGCSDGDHGGAGGPAGPGGPGGKVTGKDCRNGQYVIGWIYDGGTPAVRGDRISWKWMAADAPKLVSILDAIAENEEIPWPCHLCEKEILGGNFMLHLPK